MPSVGPTRSDVSSPCPPMLFVRSPNASILAVATDTVAPGSSMLTVPSAGIGAASAVDGVRSLLHGRQRGRSDSFTLASPSHRTCFPAMSFPCCAVRRGEAAVIATAMDLPSSNYSITATTPPPRWSLPTCSSNFPSHSFLSH